MTTTTTERQRPKSLTLQLAAQSLHVASEEDRIIRGSAVPYGPVGESSFGKITFSKGSLSWASVGRVKLLVQHDPMKSVGYAVELEDTDGELQAAFYVPEGEDGDKALAEARDGRRDGLSVGVMLNDDVLAEMLDKWFEGDESPTAAAGHLLEVSLVSIPAFDDARTEGSMAASVAEHMTCSVHFGGTETEAQPSHTKEKGMTTTPVLAASVPDEAATPAPAPDPIAGGAVVTAEAPVYTFDGKGSSFVRDAFNAHFGLDIKAVERLQRFTQMMVGGSEAQVRVLTAAVETRATLTNFIQQGYRPDLLVEAIDKGRPLVSRIGTVPLTDATPFRLPVEGDFTGVGDHTEGTAHVAEGDMTASEVLFTPGAISGAYRVSRELVDASNPALDQVALRAMTRNYRAQTEAKVVAALLAADPAATLNIDKVLELRAELNNFYDIADEPASFVVASTSYVNTLLADVDSTGRPHLASINPTNAVGEVKPGSSGYQVDGIEIIKSAGVAVNDAFIVNANDVLIGESALQTFRFDEVEGPGVIKLALWAYFVAKATRAASVVQITSAAA